MLGSGVCEVHLNPIITNNRNLENSNEEKGNCDIQLFPFFSFLIPYSLFLIPDYT